MRIAIVGTGKMGRGFVEALSAKHEVVVGSRDPERAARIAARSGAALGTANADAVDGAGVVILAVPWPALQETVVSLGGLGGSVVVDVTNPMNREHREALKGRSTPELIRAWAPDTKVVKAWNHVHARFLTAPEVDGLAQSVLIAGDETEAKRTVSTLARDIGFDPVDVGPLRAARDLEKLVATMTFVKLGAIRVLSSHRGG